MEKFNRAVRRHHTARLKAKRKTYWGNGKGTKYSPYMTARQLGIVVHTPQICSCGLGCGNARRCYGRTRKELVHIVNLKEGVSCFR